MSRNLGGRVRFVYFLPSYGTVLGVIHKLIEMLNDMRSANTHLLCSEWAGLCCITTAYCLINSLCDNVSNLAVFNLSMCDDMSVAVGSLQ